MLNMNICNTQDPNPRYDYHPNSVPFTICHEEDHITMHEHEKEHVRPIDRNYGVHAYHPLVPPTIPKWLSSYINSCFSKKTEAIPKSQILTKPGTLQQLIDTNLYEFF